MLDLLVDDLHRIVDLGDLRRALALAKYRVLRLPLGVVGGAALLDDRFLGRARRLPRGFEPLSRLPDGLLATRDSGLTRCEGAACFLRFAVDLADLGASLAIAFPRLREFHFAD